jgi:hypothetical protein
MSLSYTTEELLEEIRNQYVVGDAGSQGTTDADLLRYLNKEMMLELIPQVAKLHEEFFVVTELITLTVTGALGDNHIAVPDRAVGQSLRDLFLIRGGSRIELPRINREDLSIFEGTVGVGNSLRGFFIEGGRIRTFPSVTAGDKLEVAYLFRPSQLVKSSGYRKITALDTTLKTVTMEGSGSPFVAGDLVDIHGPNSGAEIRVWDNEVVSVAANVLTLTDPIDGTDPREGRQAVAVGDYVCARETCAIPMLPRELHPALAQAAIVRLAEAFDDQEKYAMHLNQLNRELKLMEFMVGKRVHGRPRIIVNAGSPLWKQGNVNRRSI